VEILFGLSKNNQSKTREAIEQLFAPQKRVRGLGCPPMDFSRAQTLDKEHVVWKNAPYGEQPVE